MLERKPTPYFLLLPIVLTGLLVPLLIGQAGSESREKSQRSASPTPYPVKARALPDSISNQPEDIALAQAIDRVLDGTQLTHARWGVFVLSLKDGRVLYSRDGEKLFTPASNMKVYTTAAALD